MMSMKRISQGWRGGQRGLCSGKMSETTKEADIESLAELLEVSGDYINEQLSASWVTDDVFVPVRSIAVDDQELIDQVIQIPGVMVNTTSAREYPYGQTLALLYRLCSGDQCRGAGSYGKGRL